MMTVPAFIAALELALEAAKEAPVILDDIRAIVADFKAKSAPLDETPPPDDEEIRIGIEAEQELDQKFGPAL